MSKPKVKYWHVWTDENGISHQTQCELSNFEKESMGGDAAPQWNDHLLSSDAEVLFTVQPVNWVGEWHENPKPQWIVPLSGKWFVETMDGTRVEMGAGDISFGGDQKTKSNDEGNKGHLSGTVGDEPAVLMVVQLKDEKWIAAQPGDFS
jgi:hypothetical protein